MIDVQSLIKYLLEGLAVAVAAYYIPRKTANLQEIVILGATAAAVFAVLDQFAPSVSSGARQGAGFGIGYNITTGLEGFSDDEESSAPAHIEVDRESSDPDSDSVSDSGCDKVEPYSDDIEPFSSLL